MGSILSQVLVKRDVNVINYEGYRKKKLSKLKEKDIMGSTFERGKFVIEELNRDGYIVLRRGNTRFKMLENESNFYSYQVGGIIDGLISRKLFYVYWELVYVDTYKDGNK